MWRATFDPGNLHVRFDERREETERCRMAQATAPLFDSTHSGHVSAGARMADYVKDCTSNRPQTAAGPSSLLGELADALCDLMEDVQPDAKQRKFIWPDQSVQHIQKQYPDFRSDWIEEYLIDMDYAPEHYS
jgi:hypothetical protein